jgi:hypothetical protein
MLKLAAAIFRGIKEFLSSTAMGTLKTLDRLLQLPGLLLFGGGPRMPCTPPTFEPAVDPRELIAELSNGHTSALASAPAADLVGQVIRFSKLPKNERMQLDLSQFDMAARARLLSMKEADLAELSRSSRTAIERFLVPTTKPASQEMKTDDLAFATSAELRRRVQMFLKDKDAPCQMARTLRAR